LKKRKLWTEDVRERWYAEAMNEVGEAARIAEAVPRPALETIFSDVYEQMPAHLRKTRSVSFELARRKGDASAGDGAFPL
jgi:TPP-dependent pyruvate/acetoin dehydrogenase alpha subunit